MRPVVPSLRQARKWSRYSFWPFVDLLSQVAAAINGDRKPPRAGWEEWGDLRALAEVGLHLLSREELQERHGHRPKRNQCPAYLRVEKVKEAGGIIRDVEVPLYLLDVQTVKHRPRIRVPKAGRAR